MSRLSQRELVLSDASSVLPSVIKALDKLYDGHVLAAYEDKYCYNPNR